MTDIDALIARVLELDAEATAGPWQTSGSESSDIFANWFLGDCMPSRNGRANAALIVGYRTAAPELARECQRLRECLTVVRRALPERPPGALDHAWNEQHDIGRMNYTMNVTRGQLHAAYTALERLGDD